jgi:hypothetical protein
MYSGFPISICIYSSKTLLYHFVSLKCFALFFYFCHAFHSFQSFKINSEIFLKNDLSDFLFNQLQFLLFNKNHSENIWRFRFFFVLIQSEHFTVVETCDQTSYIWLQTEV